MKHRNKFIVKVSLEGAAFENDDELVRILRDLAERVSMHRADLFMLQDINGNTCGTAKYTR